MSKFRKKHAYGAVVGGFNFETKTDMRNIADQLNHIKDNMEKYLARSINRLVDEDTTELNQKQGLQAAAARWFMIWFYGTFRVKTVIKTLPSNPDGDRDGKALYEEYIRNGGKISEFEPKLYDTERLKIFDVALKDGEIVGGLSFWRLFQHAYSLLKAIQSDLGDKAIHVSHRDKITEKYVIKIAEAMNAKKAEQQTEQKQEPIVEDVTGEFVEEQYSADVILELLEAKEVSVSELKDVDKLNEVYQNASSGIKGAITRRKKELV